jgi:hypothetical protein
MRLRDISVVVALLLGVLALAREGAAQNCSIPNNIGCWQGNGNADDSVGGNHGVNVGATFRPGQHGLAFDFDGESHVRVPNYPKPTSQMSAEAWVCARSRPGNASIAKNWGGTQGSQFHFGLAGGGLLQIEYSQGAVTDTEPLPLNLWTHVAFVADGAQMHLYRNGSEVGTPDAYDGTLPAPLPCLGIGVKLANDCAAPDAANPGYWDGLIDELSLYDRGLTPAEVAAIFAAGSVGSCLSVAEVPSMNRWGAAALALALIGVAIWRVRRRGGAAA